MVRFDWPEGVDLDTLSDGIAVTSNSLHRRYGRYGIDVDDIRQELWIWSMKKTAWLIEWMCREDPVEQRRGYAALTKSLRRAGERYCRKEKAAILGYKPEDEYFYDIGIIKDWLSVRENGVGVLTNTEYVGKIKRMKVASEGWNVEATLADLERALDALEPGQRALVVSLYGEGNSAQVVAADFGVSRQAIEQQAQRALLKMVDALGGRSPW